MINNFFKYYSVLSETQKSGGFILFIDDVSTDKELFSLYAQGLQFPSYFGYNWDALYDCLSDLDWLQKYNIQIIHTGLPQLSRSNLATYIEILYAVCREWNKWNEAYDAHSPTMEKVWKGRENIPKKRYIQVFFKDVDKDKIDSFLKQMRVTEREEETFWWEKEINIKRSEE